MLVLIKVYWPNNLSCSSKQHRCTDSIQLRFNLRFNSIILSWIESNPICNWPIPNLNWICSKCESNLNKSFQFFKKATKSWHRHFFSESYVLSKFGGQTFTFLTAQIHLGKKSAWILRNADMPSLSWIESIAVFDDCVESFVESCCVLAVRRDSWIWIHLEMLLKWVELNLNRGQPRWI